MAVLRTIRGDTFRHTWILTGADNLPVDLTGADARLQLRNRAGAMIVEATILDGGLTTSETLGEISAAIPYADMDIAPGDYAHEIEVTFTDATRKTYARGVVQVVDDIVRDYTP
jgi:hypothetical protein